MKKTLLALLLLVVLLTVSTASAKKYTPDDDIGLFIDKEQFGECISKFGSPVVSYESGSSERPTLLTEHDLEEYTLENGIVITNNLAFDSTKITSIHVTFPKDYAATDFMVYVMTGAILDCTGLLYDDEDYGEAMSLIRAIGWYNNDSSYEVRINTDSKTQQVNVDYYDYWKATGRSPYDVTNYYKNCDSNYVGACIPAMDYRFKCSDMGARNFFVVGEDIYNYDIDGNGVCCEPYEEGN